MAEGRESSRRSLRSELKGGDRRPGGFRSWLNANWATLVMLLFIFLLALFVRSYFAYEISVENGYIVSGGSDSYYWRRIIDYSVETGKQLFWDPLTAYPDGIRNPRPPLFSFSIVVPAVALQNLFSSLDDAVGFMFLWSTAFWGAMTVFPTYLLGKETFGRRTGLVAAFVLAFTPAHVSRSVLSNADHDAFILFFIVLTFYFLLKAVKAQEERKWVDNWRSLPSIKKGLGDYVRSSRTSIIYALLAGTAYACVMMAWVGFGYVTVLILAYYIIQILFNKFRNIDSTSVTMTIAIVMAFGYLLALPVYYHQMLIPTRFDVPVYLFLASFVFGMMFMVSRDLPWTLTFPAVGLLVAVFAVVITVVDPTLGQAILSGQGYFVKSKLYSTIAEAQAPQFSELALSFGMVTFFLALMGMLWAVIKLPKKATAGYILISVWLAAAIFMAISAARFMFNAAPAFAIASAWVTVIIIDKLDFNAVRKMLVGASGSYWQVLKKSVKVRHVVGVLFLAFMVVLPNLWHSVDAGIPSQSKREYDKQVYEYIPSFMRPEGYDAKNGSNWYFGAFGYSLDLPTYYFPSAWRWFSQQDRDLPPAQRPAFVAWWDYGFEAIQQGQHPTVADNFQNGYQITGNVLMAQSEDEAIAVFAYKLIETAYPHEDLRLKVEALLEKYGMDVDRMAEIVQGPAQPIIDEVLSDPQTFGPMDRDLSAPNARITAGRVELMKVGLENLVSFYDELCDVTGWSIRYFLVDSRMFPLSGRSTGIFYAPAKLSDRRIKDGSTPYDFYVVKAILDTGAVVDLDKVKPTDTISTYTLDYQDMFFDSMFYRAMVGFSPSDIGYSNDEGIPGWTSTGAVYTKSPMPGWNLTHFRMVYRTVYYNPWPAIEVEQHQDDWRAIGIDEARALKAKIDAGEATGYIDEGARSFYTAGASILKYYHGAIVNGTLTTESGDPIANAAVTVYDEYDIPHQVVWTDAQGRYSAIAPFGNVTIYFSMGSVKNEKLRGSDVIGSIKFHVTDEQAMRLPYDLDGDGVLDYLIRKDYVAKGGQVIGDVFWDVNDDGNYTADTDELIPGVVVWAFDTSSGKAYKMEAPDGSLDGYLPPGQYDFYAVFEGRNVTMGERINVTASQAANLKLSTAPGGFTGTLYRPDGSPAPGIELVLTSLPYGHVLRNTTDANGTYSFNRLAEGTYQLSTTEPGWVIFDKEVFVSEGVQGVSDALISPSSTITFRITLDGRPVPYAAYAVMSPYHYSEYVTGIADAWGMFTMEVPKGIWTVYANHFDGVSRYAAAVTVSTEAVSSCSGVLALVPATYLTGSLRLPSNAIASAGWVCFESSSGTRVWSTADTYGTYVAVLPEGTYRISAYSASESGYYSDSIALSGSSANHQIRMSTGVKIGGSVRMLKDVYSAAGPEAVGSFAQLTFVDSKGNRFSTVASANGSFSLVFPMRSQVTLALGNQGYRDWRLNVTFDAESSSVVIEAEPDERVVSGYVVYNGVGLRNIQVAFIPTSPLSQTVYATTGVGGYFRALVPPSDYTVVVDQLTGPAGGEKYQYGQELTILPGGDPFVLTIEPVKRVEVHGNLLGAGAMTQLKFEGPESLDTSVSALSYSVYLLPGEYSVYAASTSGDRKVANMTVASVSIHSRRVDLQLLSAQTVSGTALVNGLPATKQVAVTATSATGSVLRATSSRTGMYSISLPRGTFTLEFLLEDVHIEGSRYLYVEHYASEQVVVGSSDIGLSPELAMRMDNTTFSGRVLGPAGLPQQALLQLLPSTSYGRGIEFITASDGSFSVSVQPGDYTVYATRLPERSVSLTWIEIARNHPMDMTIALSSGRYLSATVSVAGSPASLPISISSGNAELEVSSDSSGQLRVLLPPGEYYLDASTTRLENSMSVGYSLAETVVIGSDNVFRQLVFDRDTRHSVSATWNRALVQSALPGEKVTYTVEITNNGNVDDTFTLSFTGQAGQFDVKPVQSSVTIGFGPGRNKGTIQVEITPKATVSAGEQRVPVQVRAKATGAARSDVNLYVNVLVVRNVTLKVSDDAKAVSSVVAVSKFMLNNTGNAQDNFALEITNLDALRALGWEAALVDYDTGAPVTTIGMPSQHSTPVGVSFRAIRPSPDPTAKAVVRVYSTHDPSVSVSGAVPVQLPDMSIGTGDLRVTRSDVQYEYDMSHIILDLVLLAATISLFIGIIVLRRRKGLPGMFGKRGGEKK
ncbi:MAG: STT3 domain-containing protein [Thermoplasmata archaeon]